MFYLSWLTSFFPIRSKLLSNFYKFTKKRKIIMDDTLFQEIHELYENFKTFTPFSTSKLTESGDKIDNTSENYFELLISKLDITLTKLSADCDEFVKILSMKTSLIYEKAKLFLSANCLLEAKELLETALNLISKYIHQPQVTFLYLRIINNLSYILSRTNELQRAKELLEANIDSLATAPLIYSTEDLFNRKIIDSSDDNKRFSKLVINNMQMLCWLYEKLGLYDLYAAMQHKSLQKQIDLADGDPLNWATRCCRLANLFLTQHNWSQARHHLSAAEAVLDRLELQVNTNSELNKAQALLASSWVQFGLQLFATSKEKMLEHIYGKEFSDIFVGNVKHATMPEEFLFTGLVMTVPQVPITTILNTVQARQLFIYTHKWLKRLRLYHNLKDTPLQYVNTVMDLNELYKFLAFFEQDIDSKYNVHKKRYDALETLSNILKEMRPNCYVIVNVELLREITEVQIELMNLNLKKLYIIDGEELTQENLTQRINAVSNVNSKLAELENNLNNSQSSRNISGNEEIIDETDCDLHENVQ